MYDQQKSFILGQTDESLLSFSDNLQFFCPRTGENITNYSLYIIFNEDPFGCFCHES